MVVALAADAAWGETVRPWRVVMAMAVGVVHGGREVGLVGDWLEGTGNMMAVAMGPVLGDAVLVFLAFVVFGWGWGIEWFGKRVRRPVAWLVSAGGVVLMVW